MAATRTPEIDQCIQTGTVDEVLAIVDRFRWLPEFGMKTSQDRVTAIALEVAELERAYLNKRNQMRSEALRLLETCRKNWTAKEIEVATGMRA